MAIEQHNSLHRAGPSTRKFSRTSCYSDSQRRNQYLLRKKHPTMFKMSLCGKYFIETRETSREAAWLLRHFHMQDVNWSMWLVTLIVRGEYPLLFDIRNKLTIGSIPDISASVCREDVGIKHISAEQQLLSVSKRVKSNNQLQTMANNSLHISSRELSRNRSAG